MSMRRSSSRMSISIASSTSGIACTAANEVCRRALASKGEMRTRRWTPISAASRPKAYSPETSTVALLSPASSPGW